MIVWNFKKVFSRFIFQNTDCTLIFNSQEPSRRTIYLFLFFHIFLFCIGTSMDLLFMNKSRSFHRTSLFFRFPELDLELATTRWTLESRYLKWLFLKRFDTLNKKTKKYSLGKPTANRIMKNKEFSNTATIFSTPNKDS